MYTVRKIAASAYNHCYDAFMAATRPFRRILKICQYIPVLWKDEDWDYSFFLVLMRYKLSRMRKCILDDEIIADNKKIARQIGYAIFLIDRYFDSDRMDSADWQQHEEKWGKFHLDWLGIKPGLNECIMGREKVVTEQDRIQEQTEFMNLIQKYHDIGEDSKHRLFRHIERYLERWWD